MKQFNCKEKDAFILKNYKNMTNQEMAEVLNCSKSTISNRRKKLGVSWTELNFNVRKNKEEIIFLYTQEGKTKSQIAKKFNCSPSFIAKILREEGCFKNRGQVYSFDEKYFDSIDGPNKAYILGLIASDGCLYRRDGHQGLVQISLHSSDIEILRLIKNELKSNHKISVNKQMVNLSLTSDYFFNSILKIGIGVRKTFDLDLNLIFKNIPLKHHCDFIRGYFDGDGSISQDNSNPSKTKVRISAPETSCLVLKNQLKLFGIEVKYYQDKRKYSYNFGSLEFSGIGNKYNFLKFIYFNEGIHLNRKKELVEIFFGQVENNITNRAENIKAVNCYANVVVKWGELLGSL